MAFVLKTSPQHASPGSAMTASERTMYGGEAIARGDELFLWFSERQGGDGLAFQGHVTDVAPGADGKPGVACIVTNATVRPLGKGDLEAWRDVDDGSAMAGLAYKLYYQAHNKIAALTPDEADLMRGHFRITA